MPSPRLPTVEMDTAHTEGGVSRFELLPEESFSEGVVRVAASLTGFEPVPGASAPTVGGALDPLHTAVDPEALDAIFRATDLGTGRDRGRVTFPYHGYEITVRGDGTISAARLDATTETA